MILKKKKTSKTYSFMNWEQELKQHMQKRDDGLDDEHEKLKVYIFDDTIGQHIMQYIAKHTGIGDELSETIIITGANTLKDFQLEGCPTVQSGDGKLYIGIDGIITIREHYDTMFNRGSLHFSSDTTEKELLNMILPYQTADTNKKETRIHNV